MKVLNLRAFEGSGWQDAKLVGASDFRVKGLV